MAKSKKQVKVESKELEVKEVESVDLPVSVDEVEDKVNETLPSLPRNIRRAYHKMLGLPQFKKQFEAYAKKQYGK